MPEPRFASTAARALATELGIDAGSLSGSGRAGAITIADVRAAAPDEPKGLGEEGRALWSSVVTGLPAGWEFDERETAILTLAARQADDLAALQAVIAREGPIAVGSTGQPVVHPAVAEARQARLAIGRLLGQLGVPDEAGSRGTAASMRGQRAARARWGRRGAVDHAQVGML
jgi:pyruvate/2-oxoglutarate dehydrogenase complex dihydrolipoamide acyltransferase (E2) component